MSFNEKIFYKLKKETGLNDSLALWYNMFISESCPLDDIVKQEDIKEIIRDNILGEDNNSETEKVKDILLNNLISKVEKIFERKKLIDYQMIEDGKKYPRIIGYNYFKDPEFYSLYKHRTETEWINRISMNNNVKTITNLLIKGYEFKEKEIINFICN
ncbi:MAG: hypothetical protein ACP5N1_02765 [Candidatus Woesearchaeota archaeon]